MHQAASVSEHKRNGCGKNIAKTLQCRPHSGTQSLRVVFHFFATFASTRSPSADRKFALHCSDDSHVAVIDEPMPLIFRCVQRIAVACKPAPYPIEQARRVKTDSACRSIGADVEPTVHWDYLLHGDVLGWLVAAHFSWPEYHKKLMKGTATL